MRLPAKLAIISILLFSCAGFRQYASSQSKPAKKTAEATFSGKVTIKGKPAPGIVVGIRSSKSEPVNPTLKATTDREGDYRISGLPPGSYVVAPMAPAFIISDVNYSGGRTLVITEAESIEGIDFDLTRGGVITGRVTDADGHPIIEEHVTLLPQEQIDRRGGPDFSLSASFQTNDQGVYRVFGIRPGRYRVSIGDEQNAFFFGRGKPAFRRTFSPNTTDPMKAAIVEVNEGTEAAKIDITLSPTVPGFSVTGRIVDEGGKGVPNTSIGLSRTIDNNGIARSEGPTGVLSDNQGEFRLQNLQPGTYSVRIYPPAESALRAGSNSFEINDQDVSGLLIRCSNGAGLSGTVVLEGSNENRATAKFSNVFIIAMVEYSDSSGPGFGRSAWIQSDGSFRIGGFSAGTVRLSLRGDAVGGLVISRIERDGVVQQNGIQLKDGEQVTGIRVVVVRNNGAIRGVVKMENGTWPSSGRLFVQLSRQGDSQGNAGGSEPDSRGHFLIEGLAAGSYELKVTAYVPESRLRVLGTTQVVKVTEGSTTDVMATIDLSSTPAPLR